MPYEVVNRGIGIEFFFHNLQEIEFYVVIRLHSLCNIAYNSKIRSLDFKVEIG